MSRGWPWYKAYPRDFLDDTIGWPADIKGAYRIVLDLLYMHDGYLVDDAAYITAHVGLSSKRKWMVIREELIKRGKIQAQEGVLTNHRALIETENRRKTDDKLEINESVSSKNNDLSKTESDSDSYKTPNPLKGDDAALGLIEIFEGDSEGIEHKNAKPTAKPPAKPKKPEATESLGENSNPQSEAKNTQKPPDSGPTPANPPPERCVAQYRGSIAVPIDWGRQRPCEVRVADSRAMGRANAFEGMTQPRRQPITARSECGREVSAKGYAGVLREAGFEMSSFALDGPSADYGAMARSAGRYELVIITPKAEILKRCRVSPKVPTPKMGAPSKPIDRVKAFLREVN